MKQRFVDYFKQNKWWIFSFLVIMLLDSVLTLTILIGQFGQEANPLIGGHMFDWTFHFLRIDSVLLIIPFVALTPIDWKFTRNWLIQGVTVGYAWSVVNEICILLFKCDINIYQFLPGWAYFFGVAFQFGMGMLILWVYRKVRGEKAIQR